MSSNKSKGRAYTPPKPLKFPKDINLDSPLGLIKFMQQAVRDIYESKISSRQAGALNGAITNLMNSYGMGDYRLEEMAKRIEELEKISGIRAKTGGARTIPGIATAIQDT
jgi:hypothetical protein